MGDFRNGLSCSPDIELSHDQAVDSNHATGLQEFPHRRFSRKEGVVVRSIQSGSRRSYPGRHKNLKGLMELSDSYSIRFVTLQDLRDLILGDTPQFQHGLSHQVRYYAPHS